ncbi:MAG TPA: MarR family transcriptional regulator [Pseudonocardiaceae bacterium]|nr:MarR family transcriptional regulator [Pseudonocardiaceae bacterium]
MVASRERTHRDADAGGGSAVLADGNSGVVTAQDVDWLVDHLRAVVVASPTVWAGRGMTLDQLTALHVIGALAPVGLTDLAQALGTRPPATSAMVDRLIDAGLVCRTPDPTDRRRVRLSFTADAQAIIGDTDPGTGRRVQAVLRGMGRKTRRHLIDILVDTIRRSVT